MSQERKARIQEINEEFDLLRDKEQSLLKERNKLELEEALESHPCSCVKLNKDIEVYDMIEQERRGRKGLGFGLVGDTLSARKDCKECHGTGKPGPKHEDSEES